MQYNNLLNGDKLPHKVLNTNVNIDDRCYIQSYAVDGSQSGVKRSKAVRAIDTFCSMELCEGNGSVKYCCSNCHILQNYFAQ